MMNLFAFRATDPKEMKRERSPIGWTNNFYLVDIAKQSDLVVAAWGAHGSHLNRGEQVRELLPNLHCLRLTKDGYPGHPLYLPKDLNPIPY